MSELLIKSIIQEGGEKLSNSKRVEILNLISKHINKKMKILEYKYGIKVKLSKLPENNEDSIPRKIGVQTFAQVNGPLKGQIPFYTTTDIALPTFSTVTTGVPVTPYGPFVGVPSLAINPFGTTSDLLEERIKKATETLEKYKKIAEKLKKAKEEDKACKDLSDDSIKKCFECIDLDEEKNFDELKTELDKIIIDK